ncbi:MAG: hypothetical protein AAGE99_05110 [Chlamydiota bacterium]
MITRATIFASLFLTLFTSALIFGAFYFSKDLKSVEKVLTEEIRMAKEGETSPDKQLRSRVSKDLWFSENGATRLHYHIESPRSILTPIPDGNRLDLVEQMFGMKCYFQEKIDNKEGIVTQQIRYLESEEGIYRYTDHYFDAHSVSLALYRLPGETLTTDLDAKEAYLEGIAEGVTLSLAGETPDFHAEKFKAHIRAQGNIQ